MKRQMRLRKSAGYKLQGMKRWRGLTIAIENRKGSVRRGVDGDGTPWATKMFWDYGGVRGTSWKAVDGDLLDVFLGPNKDASTVFVIHQQDPKTGKFDEDKCMLGFDDWVSARDAYLAHYDDQRFLPADPKRAYTAMSFEEFKRRIFDRKNGRKGMVKAVHFGKMRKALPDPGRGVPPRAGLILTATTAHREGKPVETHVWRRPEEAEAARSQRQKEDAERLARQQAAYREEGAHANDAEYEWPVTGSDGQLKLARGAVRSIHGHHVFAAGDGALYEYKPGSYHPVWEEVAKPNAYIAERANEAPEAVIGVEPESIASSQHHLNWDLRVTGLSERKRRAIAAVGFQHRNGGYLHHQIEAGEPLKAYAIDGGLRDLPNTRWTLGAARAFFEGASRRDRVAASTAAAIGKRREAAEEKSPEEVRRAQAAQAATRLKEARAKQKEAKASAGKAAAKLAKLPPMAALINAIADGAGEPEKVRPEMVRLVAGLWHAGLLREATRGAIKGWITTEWEALRAILKDPAPQADALLAAQLLNCVHPGVSQAENAGAVSFPDGKRLPEAAREALGSSSKSFAAAKLGRCARAVAQFLGEHNTGERAPELQALLTGQADAQAIARGKRSALRAVSKESAQAGREELLKAQADGAWEAPAGFTMAGFGKGARLHEYQVKGVNWALAAKRGVNGFSCGLGKSLVALAVALKLNAEGKTDKGFILAPVPLLLQWQEEARKAAPAVKTLAVMADGLSYWNGRKLAEIPFGGSGAARKAERAKLIRQYGEKAELVIAGTSALLMEEFTDFAKAHPKASLQCDEAHRLRRKGEGITAKLEALTAGREYAIGYTATPVPNYDTDFFNIMELWRPGVLGTRRQFLAGRKTVDEIIAGGKSGERADLSGLAQIHEQAKPYLFIKDRADADVALHVPKHLEETLDVEPAESMRHWWNWSEQYAMKKASKYAGRTQLLVFASTCLNMQRQLAISPALVLKHLHEEWEDAHDPRIEPNAALAPVEQHLRGGIAGARGAADYQAPEGCEPKIDEAVAHVRAQLLDSKRQGQPLVIVSDYREALSRVRHRLVDEGILGDADVLEYSGATGNAKKRKAVQDRVNAGEAGALLLQMQAGGVGLNLQGDKGGRGPKEMFLLNEPWTHAELRQVTDRISRQGQTVPTTSYVARMHGSPDDKVAELVAGKHVASEAITHGGALNEEELGRLGEAAKLPIRDQLRILNLSPAVRERLEGMVRTVEAQEAAAAAAKEAAKAKLAKGLDVAKTRDRKPALMLQKCNTSKNESGVRTRGRKLVLTAGGCR